MKFLIFSFLFPCVLFSQTKGAFTMDYGISVANFTMTSPEKYIATDTTYKYGGPRPVSGRFNNLSFGLAQDFSVIYQPYRYLDVGFTSSYQFSKYKNEFSDPNVVGDVFNRINSMSGGVVANLHLHTLLHFEQNTSVIMKRLNLTIGIKGLYGRSEFHESSRVLEVSNDFSNDWKNFRYQNNHFLARAELNIGYTLFHKTLFSVIGLKIGYQYGKTGELKNYNDQNLKMQDKSGETVRLDFGGLYSGIYVKIGK